MTPVLSGQHICTEDVLRAEREVLNVDHGRAGAWLVNNWCLPRDFSEICEHHHDAAKAHDSEILQLVKASCKIADAIGFPAVKCEQQPSYLEAASSLTPLLGRKVVPPAEDMCANVTGKLAVFQG